MRSARQFLAAATSPNAKAPARAPLPARVGVRGHATLHEDGRKTTTDRTQVPFRDFFDIIRDHQISPLPHVQKTIQPTSLLVIHLLVKR